MLEIKFGYTLTRSGDILEEAKAIEDLGFDSLWVAEHVVWRHPVQDALMLLAAAATVTKRVRLGTSILLLPLKHPLLVAKAVTTLDHLSNGRASLGIGIGGEYQPEFDAMQIPKEERGARANDAIQLMKRLWTEDNVTFESRFYPMEDITVDPKPVQKPHPPILVGGRRKALPRVARYGDGWLPYLYTPEMYREDWVTIKDLAVEAGRDPAAIEPTVYAFIVIDKSYEAAAAVAAARLQNTYAQSFDKLVYRYPIIGTPEQCAERVNEYVEAGCRHVIFTPAAPPDQAKDFPKTIAEEIFPRFR
jgi:probable F420-dependent oxidoreductase